jgi:hypothetical protein
MGLLTAPIRGLLRVFEAVAEQAEHEQYNEEAVKAELTDLYRALAAGSLSEEDFGRSEAALVERLEQIEERKRRRAGRGAR